MGGTVTLCVVVVLAVTVGSGFDALPVISIISAPMTVDASPRSQSAMDGSDFSVVTMSAMMACKRNISRTLSILCWKNSFHVMNSIVAENTKAGNQKIPGTLKRPSSS